MKSNKKTSISGALYAKPPIPGYVKTRLAADLGNKNAADLYSLILTWQRDNLQNLINFHGSDISLSVWFAAPAYMTLSKAKKLFLNRNRIKSIKYYLQSNGSLGSRMSDTFENLFQKSDYAFIWGSDIPLITQSAISSAIQDSKNACIIPALDGGYSLIAIPRIFYHRDLFTGIPWSHSETLTEQIKKFKECNVPLKIIDPIPDLDNLKDILINIQWAEKKRDTEIEKRILQLNGFLRDLAKNSAPDPETNNRLSF